MRVFYRLVATMLSALVVFLFVATKVGEAAGPTVITANITTPTTWVKENSPYIVSNSITVNATLTIEPGVIVKFNNNATNNTPAGFSIKSDFSAVGTAEEKIVFTSICDSDYGGDTTSYSSRCHSGPIDSEWSGISMYETSAHVDIEYALIFRAGHGIAYQNITMSLPYKELRVKHTEIRQCATALYVRNTMPTLSFNILEGNTYGLDAVTNFSNRVPVIRDSSFLNNGVAVITHYPGLINVDARFNWWGDATGPYFQSANPALDNSGGLGNRVIQDRIKFRPWLESEPDNSSLCVECASNILFLPGIKGSKLYKDDGTADGDTLWLPTILSDDLEELGMDENGQSRSAVYTKDVLATIPFGSLYESFLQKMASLKTNGTINDYQSFAYDWRNNVEDIVRNGVLYPTGIVRSLVNDAEVLARSSKTRKISIIAHSNGGLLAKALMRELEERGLESEVETVVFVGTPQMGTPLAILSLLYGYDEPIPALISQARARTLAENIPGAYGLLPSEEYFNRMSHPFITFSSEHTRYQKFREVYGDDIGDYWESYSFLHADDDGRSKPSADDIDLENVLNGTLMDQVKNTHERLDSWVAPSGVEVVQIAGWGLDTVSGVDYTEKSLAKCYYSGTSVPSCVNEGQYEPVYDPQFTVDGDEVVVTPSALMMSEGNSTKQYWIDLYRYNDVNSYRKHRDLLEINSVQTLLSNILTHNESAPLPEYIQTTRPDDPASAKPRLRMALYSPLDVHLYDTHGHHTGPKKMTVDGQEVTVFEEGIPNSYYYQFGEHKYVGFPEGESIRAELDGYDLGAYTLKLSEVRTTATGEEEIAHTTFENLPTTADTTVKFSVPGTGIADMSPLVADVTTDDGVKQYSVTPVINGVATYEEARDTLAPVTTATVVGTGGADGWYTSDVTVTLVVTDEAGGSGVEKTEYSLDDGVSWNEYSMAVTLVVEGTTSIRYFSTDAAGNKEAVKTETVKIDKTVPEAKMTFDPIAQKLSVIGQDNLGGDVAVTMTELSVPFVGPRLRNHDRSHEEHRNKKKLQATLIDEAGHATRLTILQEKKEKNELTFAVQSIAYGSTSTSTETRFMGTGAEYQWQMNRKKQYQELETRLVSMTKRLESRYMAKKNETWIREWTDGQGDGGAGHDHEEEHEERRDESTPEWQKLPGMVIPYLQTQQGQVSVRY